MLLEDKDTRSLEERLEPFFIPPGLIWHWKQIKVWDDYFEFSDKLSDEEMFSEFVYVNEQFKKFVASHEKSIKSNIYDADKLAIEVEAMLADSNEKPSMNVKTTVRAQLVYFAMRNQWLTDMLTTIQYYIEEVKDGRA